MLISGVGCNILINLQDQPKEGKRLCDEPPFYTMLKSKVKEFEKTDGTNNVDDPCRRVY